MRRRQAFVNLAETRKDGPGVSSRQERQLQDAVGGQPGGVRRRRKIETPFQVSGSTRTSAQAGTPAQLFVDV